MQSEFDFHGGPKEEWKLVAGFINYEASTFGRFRHKYTGRILHGTVANNGYVHIGLTREKRQITKLAHRLVAETYHEKPSPLHNDVNHKNKVRNDNRPCNLEWNTRSQNSLHAKHPAREYAL